MAVPCIDLAEKLVRGLTSIPGFELTEPAEGNMLFIIIPDTGLLIDSNIARLVISHNVDESHIDRFVA